MKPLPTSALLAATLSLILASCGQQQLAPQPVAVSGDQVKLTLTAPLGKVKAQGLPTDPTGASTVKDLSVQVLDAQGQSVRYVSLSSDMPSATIVLPRGTYSFVNVGRKTSGGTFLAYGRNEGVDLNTGSSTVKLDLHALADADATTFTDKLGWKSVATQETLDLRLNVMNADGTLVPTGDFSPVSYAVVDADGNPVGGTTDSNGNPVMIGSVLGGSSKLGARVYVTGSANTAKMYVRASFEAWQATGPETAEMSTMSKTFSIDFDKTGLVVDTQAPSVTLAPVGTVTAGQALALSGSVSDDSGNVAAVRVYDGAVLVGSTDPSEYGMNDVSEISLEGSTWSMSWMPATSGAADLVVIAADKAGNEGRAQSTKALKFARTFGAGYWYHNVAVKTDGTVAAWGYNGQLQTDVPAGLTNVVQAVAGTNYSLALKADGTVVGWGADYSNEATPPAGLSGVVQIAAGYSNSLALKSDGTVVAWGNSNGGQANVPAGLSDVVQVAAGQDSLALKKDGTVVHWGSSTFVPDGLSGVAAISASMFGRYLALKTDGTVVAWDNGAVDTDPVATGLTDVVGIAQGPSHDLALKSDGTVVAWGSNSYGQLNVPAGLTDVVAISGGNTYSMALKSDGTFVFWGLNDYGQFNVPAGQYLIP